MVWSRRACLVNTARARAWVAISVLRSRGARSAVAAFSERSRIRAAPRFDTSSILSSVWTSPAASRISCTWSAVIASTPQPKEFSCTSDSVASPPTTAAASYRREW